MRNRKALDRAGRFLKFIYLKLVKIDDSPQKIALGLGLGVFAGVMPFAGPFIALALAILFRANRVSAFLGGLLTNTWITIAAFFFSIKIGSFLFGIDGTVIRARWIALFKDFHLSGLLKLSAFEVMLPVLVGYIAIAFFSALAAYLAAFFIMKFRENRRRQ